MWMCKSLARISLKLSKFLIAFGANIADCMSIIVPWGKITVADPCPSSIWCCPMMVVTFRCEGVMCLKYSLDFAGWDVMFHYLLYRSVGHPVVKGQ